MRRRRVIAQHSGAWNGTAQILLIPFEIRMVSQGDISSFSTLLRNIGSMQPSEIKTKRTCFRRMLKAAQFYAVYQKDKTT